VGLLAPPHVRQALLARVVDHRPTWSNFDKRLGIFHGELDAVVPVRTAETMQRLAHRASRVRFPEVGHLVFREAPDAFDAAVAEFVA
jgi:pimeloyl-ACP methyl ester carboxylesterase